MIPATRQTAPPYFGSRIALFYAGFFILNGIAMPFFPVWLESRGLTATEIATCIALPLAARVVLTPFAGVFADRAPNRRFAVRIFSAIAILIFLLAWPASGFWQLLLITTAAFVAWNLSLPVVEALALTGVRRFGLDYGRMRLSGSATFILANLASGAALAWLAPESIYWMLLASFGVALGVSLTLPVTPPAVRALDDATRPKPRARAVLGHPALLALLIAAGLIQASHAVLYSLGSIAWQSQGYDSIAIGIFWATSVVCEIVLFGFSPAAVRRFGPFGLLTIGGIAAILRWSLFSQDLGFEGFAAVQALHGLTFGATYLGTQYVIARAVPDEHTGSAQGIYVMISGLLLAMATALAGPLYNALGTNAYLVMIVPAVLGLLILAIYRWRAGSYAVRSTV
jgi:PPP family 3-phenylpropionic acid transporter